jgi:hypothetical protein
MKKDKLFYETKIGDIIAELNEAVKPLEGRKGNHKDFHKWVKDYTQIVCNKYNLSCQVWEIEVGKYSDKPFGVKKVISYWRTFDKDKRYDNLNPQGTFTDIHFKCDAGSLKVTGLELLCHIEEGELTNSINASKEHRDELEQEISRANQFISESLLKLEHIKSLKKELV